MRQSTFGLHIPIVCSSNRFQCISKIHYKLDLKRNIDTGAWSEHVWVLSSAILTFFSCSRLISANNAKIEHFRYMLGEPLYGFFTLFIQIWRVGPRGQPATIQIQIYPSRERERSGPTPCQVAKSPMFVRSSYMAYKKNVRFVLKTVASQNGLVCMLPQDFELSNLFIHMHSACRLVGSSQNLEMRWKSVTHYISTKTCSSFVVYSNWAFSFFRNVNAA